MSGGGYAGNTASGGTFTGDSATGSFSPSSAVTSWHWFLDNAGTKVQVSGCGQSDHSCTVRIAGPGAYHYNPQTSQYDVTGGPGWNRLGVQVDDGGIYQGQFLEDYYKNLGEKPVGSSKLSVDDQRIAEPRSGVTPLTFHVTLDKASTQTVTVHYATRDGTGAAGAKAGKDYRATSGSLTFAPGKTDKVVQVQVKHDSNFKGRAKRFSLVLSSPSNAELAKAIGVGTITARRVTITSVSPNHGSPAGGTKVTIKGLGFGKPGTRADVVLCPHNAGP
ncbi:MAG: hypothetical protein QOK25_1599, partial [Thermoleophilaceae bacterium]|nr:hypothetical protein [Thermoleophilaceae bacterium]